MRHMVQFASFRFKRPTALMRGAVVPVALVLSACATQAPPSQPTRVITPPVSGPEQAALRSLVAQQDRLYRVAAPLLVNNAELCKGNARNLLGFTAKNKYSYSSDMANAAQSLFGLDDQLQVMGVLANSGASRAGVRVGDKLVSVEGKPLPLGLNADRQAATILAPLVGNRSSVRLTVRRAGADQALTVPLTRACAYSIELGNADNVNAYNDGRRVMITRGMMNFVQSDTELAYVLAKEMAHNSLQHASKQNMSGTVGDIINNLIRINPDMSTMGGTAGIKIMPQDLDVAADTLSLYMAARAGYSIDQAPRFWEKLANQYPASVMNGYTAIHPSTDFRLSVMGKIVADVKSRQAKGKPLLP